METSREKAGLEIIRRLRENGYNALYAGGYVRDMILGAQKRGDIDIATGATPQQITGLFRNVVGVGEHFGVMIVVIDEIPFEVATFRKDIGIADNRHPTSVSFTDAREDALRRDFTINGMFYDPLTGEILDYVEGRTDLEKGVIRAIGDPRLRFEEDYLRMIRAVRFGARFNFSIEKKTWDALVDCAKGISKISAERIFQELDKILLGPNPDKALVMLKDSGLLAMVLPEVAACWGVEQPREFHPEGDVFAHIVLALSKLSCPTQIAAWSTLLHDIGKPGTMVVADRIRFSNHDVAGARLTERLLRRLKAPSQLIEGVYEVVVNHMNFMNVQKMRLSTLKKFLSRPTLEDELTLHKIDCLASHGDISNFDFIRQKQKELSVETIKPVPLIGGKDLIALGFKPGPVFGQMLDQMYDLQLEEKIETRQQAIDWVLQQYKI